MTHPRHLPPTAIATIIEMANGGAGWDEILAVIGCSQNTAYRHLKAAGAPRPPQRRRTKPDEEENDGEDYNIRSYRPNGELYDPYTEGRWLRCMEKMAPARDETSGGQRREVR